MLVSVVVPVYNSEKTILHSIESVVKSIEKVTQDYEIICINDGSSDDSLKICKELSVKNNKIIVVNQENLGVSAARNKGLELAKGEYIAFNDSDDEWLENHFNILLQVFSEHSDVDCVSSNHEVEFQKTYFLNQIGDNLYKVSLKAQLMKNYFSPPNTMLKRKILDCGIRFHSGMRYAEDGFFFNRIAKDFNACFLNRKCSQSILHKQRFGESGLSGNIKEMEKGELFNIKYAYKNYGISFSFYFFAKTLSLIKYLRRIIIVKIRKIRSH